MKEKPKKHQPPKVPRERPGPKGGKRDANRRDKVQLLCDVSLELFCARGVETVTIDELVAKAKVAKGSFYCYFSGKEELVETMFAPLAKELEATFKATKEALQATVLSGELNQTYSELALTLSRLLVSNLGILRLYLQESRAPAVGARRPIVQIAQEIDEFAYQLTLVARAQGLLRDDSDPRIASLISLGAVERLLFSYVRGDKMASPASVSADLIHIILDGIRV